MNPRRWLHEHSLKLLAIRDTPEAIAGGVAIGLFFGFTPLFGLRFLASMFFAWLTRSNILAAVLATTLHDVILPLMPVIYRWQYDVGFWLLSQPHHWPPPLHKTPWERHHWRDWSNLFYTVGKDWLVGSFVCMFPLAIASFFFTRGVVARHQLKKQAHPPMAEDERDAV
jgi:uncharacterized protein (DUF2062 family)